jgi:hypothetical protein
MKKADTKRMDSDKTSNFTNHETPAQVAIRLTTLLKKKEPEFCYEFKHVQDLAATREVLAASPEVQIAFLRQCCEIISRFRDKLGPHKGSSPAKGNPFGRYLNLGHEKEYPHAAALVAQRLFRRKLPFSGEDLVFMADRLAYLGLVTTHAVPIVENLVAALEKHFESSTANDQLREPMLRLSGALDCLVNAPEQKLRRRIAAMLETPALKGEALPRVELSPGEAWSDNAIACLKRLSEEKRATWMHLLNFCQQASGGAPSSAWLTKARTSVKTVGLEQFKKTVLTWFPLVDSPRTLPLEHRSPHYTPDPNQLILEPHASLLKGLVWCCSLREDAEISRALTALALSAYRKVPKKGPREVKVGNAAVIALGLMPGLDAVGQLALLKVRVKFGTAQKTIEKALEAAATRAGLPREELEEMAVPAYGMAEVGRYPETFGDFTAELSVSNSNSVSVTWSKSDGKLLRAAPQIVKEKFADDWKDFQTAVKDIQRMLPAQRERIDALFLQQKTWPLAIWHERYLNHPLVGTLARRILWEFKTARNNVTGIWFNGRLVDLDLKSITLPDQETTVRLWHPIGKATEEIIAWRSWLDAQQIQQPFKQAHREIYLLTDAERNTRTYSNRYAAHVLKQHQFNALCGLRGWKNKLRLMVDDEYPPATRHLPQWGLRAEFWVEGVGDDYGTDTNESGVYLYLSTDQVRFYRVDAAQRMAHAGGGGYRPDHRGPDPEPLPLEEIPPLVFSEIMRDVDMFVGVGSVGNDPAWSDGGRDGRYRNYWRDYSFGELNASAKTRKEVLERLIKKLKIAGRCSFRDRFLVVKGTVRSYKIHLGSGNILMEPNDQYLCIVPRQGELNDENVLLPFEGDRTLSVILSKAFLLAEDSKIKDQSILSQIKK